jgi:3-hydroxyisobutyrate dehydrogenase-like beta-hydroxyacid dehydrogenase
MPDTPLPTIGIIAPGAMGAAIGARLAHSGCTVLTTLERRSKSSHDRARDAGMQDVPFAEIIERADWVLSVVPPSEALQCARAFRDCWDSLVSTFEGSRAAVYVDCNAVNPETALEIGKVLEDAQGITYLDATIIGGPPSAPEAEKRYDPTIHVSADERNNAALRSFELLGMQGDLKIHAMDAGAGIGAASALKMAYAVSTATFTGRTAFLKNNN